MKDVNEDTPLTLREQKFVRAYLESGNQTQAAIAAGYAPSGANRVAYDKMRKPNVKKAINAAMPEILEALGLNKAWALRKMKAIVDACSQLTPVMDSSSGRQKVDPDGKPVYRMVDAATARNAAADIAKWVGLEQGEEKADTAGGVLLVDQVPSEDEWSKKHGRS
jgi:phage terminase small subunit